MPHLGAGDHVCDLDQLLLATGEEQLLGDRVECHVSDHLSAQSNKTAKLLIQHVEPPRSKPCNIIILKTLNDFIQDLHKFRC